MPEAEPSVFAFLVGTGRCGSTLVQEVLCRHPAVGFVSNVEDLLAGPAWLGRWNGPVYRRLPPAVAVKGRVRFAPSEGYRILDRLVSHAVSTPSRDLTASDATPWLAARFRTFFTSRAAAQASPLFLHKFTGWPRAAFVRSTLPEARFIHVIRDGRAVANSWLQMPWWLGYQGPCRWQWGPLPQAYQTEWEEAGRSFVVLAGLGWKLLMDAHQQSRGSVPPAHWMDVRYEDVVADPRRSFMRMLEFLGLEWTDAFEQGFARHTFRAERRKAFLRDLGGPHLELLERSLEGHLRRYGYPLSSTP